ARNTDFARGQQNGHGLFERADISFAGHMLVSFRNLPKTLRVNHPFRCVTFVPVGEHSVRMGARPERGLDRSDWTRQRVAVLKQREPSLSLRATCRRRHPQTEVNTRFWGWKSRVQIGEAGQEE
ncbi:hypothetical protein, partial [Mesorhizobium sp. M1273]|uniref:hypothetical protein n=1 Tax=Mesorhizobium sp. M1273 TaxID=2957075 RepID=UPI00333AB448